MSLRIFPQLAAKQVMLPDPNSSTPRIEKAQVVSSGMPPPWPKPAGFNYRFVPVIIRGNNITSNAADCAGHALASGSQNIPGSDYSLLIQFRDLAPVCHSFIIFRELGFTNYEEQTGGP
jgi:hypothetical protein